GRRKDGRAVRHPHCRAGGPDIRDPGAAPPRLPLPLRDGGGTVLPLNELSITRLVAGGEGLGFIEGKAVFVPGVLPGERVRVRVVQSRRDYDRAVLVDVREPSAHRVVPGCR